MVVELNSNILADIDPDANFLDRVLPENLCSYLTVDEFNSTYSNPFNFNLLNFNISSFHRNGAQFESLLESIKVQFKCIVISETWNNDLNKDLCNLPDYNGFHTTRSGEEVCSRSGGVSVFCNDDIQATKLNEISICTVSIETCVVRFEYLGKTYLILALYRPHQGSKHDFIRELDQIISSLDLSDCIVFIVGDFNLNYLDLEDSYIVEFATKLYSKCFNCLIDKPTRFPRGNQIGDPSCLDMIWTNHLSIHSAGILDYDQSDHLPTFCTMATESVSPVKEMIKIETRPYSDSNLSMFVNKLGEINWENELVYDDVDYSISTFCKKIL